MKKGKKYPDEGELVVGTVTSVRDYGAFVNLEEYPGANGFIHVSEVTNGWVKYIRDFIREGQKIVGKVTMVNRDKNQINISIKRVSDGQKRKKMQQWKNETKGRMLLERLAERLGMSPEECYEKFGYDLIEAFGGLYPAFETAVIDEEALRDAGFEGKWLEEFIKLAKENISPPFVTISGILKVSSEEPDGVEIIRNALIKAKETGDVEIHYVGSPKYRITVTAGDYKTAEKMMKNAADAAIEYMESMGEGNSAEFDRKGE